MEGFSFENSKFGETGGEGFRRPDKDLVEAFNGKAERSKEELIGEAVVLAGRVKELRDIFDSGSAFPEADAGEVEMRVNEIIPLLSDVVDSCDDFDERTRVVDLLGALGSFVAWREGRIQ